MLRQRSCVLPAYCVEPTNDAAELIHIGVDQHRRGSRDATLAATTRAPVLGQASNLAISNDEIMATVTEGPTRVTDAGRDAEFGQGGADQETEPIVDAIHRHAAIGISGYHRQLHGARPDWEGSAAGTAHQHRPTLAGEACRRRFESRPLGLAARNDQCSSDRQMKIVALRIPAPTSPAMLCSRFRPSFAGPGAHAVIVHSAVAITASRRSTMYLLILALIC